MMVEKKVKRGKQVKEGGTFFTPAAGAEVTIRACCFLFYTFPPLGQVLLGLEPRCSTHKHIYIYIHTAPKGSSLLG